MFTVPPPRNHTYTDTLFSDSFFNIVREKFCNASSDLT